jgi:NADH:ubiquinone oxidoreductase subunit 5 (subunit L)/multisubunit Na+/H+ antiporter MnhA subunit
VRALVHRSTLVTAGVWLLLRFSNKIGIFILFVLLVGLFTSLLASLAALLEKDGKKVVALSTLRQLGLLFVSLCLGNVFLCLFHVVTHAFSKANLFIMVGNILHSSYREQDLRKVFSRGVRLFTLFSVFVRLVGLSGWT